MKTVKKVIKYVLLLVGGLIAGIFMTGAISGAKDALSGDKSEAIETVLKENCDCESINQLIYMKGLQFNSKEGMTSEKGEYELINCTYESLAQETFRINEILLKEVQGYKELDLLKLEFVGPEKHETITIKNGVIQ